MPHSLLFASSVARMPKRSRADVATASADVARSVSVECTLIDNRQVSPLFALAELPTDTDYKQEHAQAEAEYHSECALAETAEKSEPNEDGTSPPFARMKTTDSGPTKPTTDWLPPGLYDVKLGPYTCERCGWIQKTPLIVCYGPTPGDSISLCCQCAQISNVCYIMTHPNTTKQKRIQLNIQLDCMLRCLVADGSYELAQFCHHRQTLEMYTEGEEEEEAHAAHDEAEGEEEDEAEEDSEIEPEVENDPDSIP